MIPEDESLIIIGLVLLTALFALTIYAFHNPGPPPED